MRQLSKRDKVTPELTIKKKPLTDHGTLTVQMSVNSEINARFLLLRQ